MSSEKPRTVLSTTELVSVFAPAIFVLVVAGSSCVFTMIERNLFQWPGWFIILAGLNPIAGMVALGMPFIVKPVVSPRIHRLVAILGVSAFFSAILASPPIPHV